MASAGADKLGHRRICCLGRAQSQPGRQPFAFAGLWESNKGLSWTIVTTEPNAVGGAILNRMPVILDSNDYGTWLSAETPPAEANALLPPFAGEMSANTVDKGKRHAAGTLVRERQSLLGRPAAAAVG